MSLGFRPGLSLSVAEEGTQELQARDVPESTGDGSGPQERTALVGLYTSSALDARAATEWVRQPRRREGRGRGIHRKRAAREWGKPGEGITLTGGNGGGFHEGQMVKQV